MCRIEKHRTYLEVKDKSRMYNKWWFIIAGYEIERFIFSDFQVYEVDGLSKHFLGEAQLYHFQAWRDQVKREVHRSNHPLA